MAADDNKGKGTGTGGGGTTGGQAAGKASSTPQGGQQISGEQIFTTTEENKSGESFATTGAGATGGASTGGVSSGGGKSENQANLSDAVTDAVSGDTSKAKEMLNQAKSATGEVASKALGQVQEKASTFVDTKTSDVAQGLSGIADTVRQFTEDLRTNKDVPIAQTVAQYGDTVTNQVERVADYLDRADLNKLTRDLETFARRNPVVFIGGAFAAGILLARFIKSSQERAALPPSRQLTAGTGRRAIGTTGSTTGTATGTSTGRTGTSGTTGTATGSATVATGEPPALGKTLPSVDSPTTGAGASDKGTKPGA